MNPWLKGYTHIITILNYDNFFLVTLGEGYTSIYSHQWCVISPPFHAVKGSICFKFASLIGKYSTCVDVLFFFIISEVKVCH